MHCGRTGWRPATGRPGVTRHSRCPSPVERGATPDENRRRSAAPPVEAGAAPVLAERSRRRAPDPARVPAAPPSRSVGPPRPPAGSDPRLRRRAHGRRSLPVENPHRAVRVQRAVAGLLHLQSGNWFEALKSDGAPFPAGWYFLERLSRLALRQHRAGPAAPDGSLPPVGCVLLMLLARGGWPIGGGRRRRPGRRPDRHAGELRPPAVRVPGRRCGRGGGRPVARGRLGGPIGRRGDPRGSTSPTGGSPSACIFSTPAIFIAGPLLLLDACVWPGAEPRRADAGARSGGPGVLAHLVVVRPAPERARSSPYWDPQFLPHDGLGHQVTFVWDKSAGSSPASSRAPPSRAPGLPPHPRVDAGIDGRVRALALRGGHRGRTSARGRHDPVRLAASQVLTLVASYLRYWPFGFVRTNFYLIPLLMLLAGIGGFCTCRYGLRSCGGRRPRPPRAVTRVLPRRRSASRCGAPRRRRLASAATARSAPIARYGGRDVRYGSKIGPPWRPCAPGPGRGGRRRHRGRDDDPGVGVLPVRVRGKGDGRRPPDRAEPRTSP